MSIRTRLTLLYTVILALTLVIFGIALYTIQERDTLISIKEEMVFSSNRFSEALLKTTDRPLPPPNTEPMPPLPFDKFSNEQEFQTISEREIVRVLDTNGDLIASPFGREGDALPLSNEGLGSLQNNQEWWEIANVDGERMLIYSKPVTTPDQLTNFVQVARSLTERDRTLRSLATTLFIAGFFTTVLAFGIGWLLSGLTLKPIQKITFTAKEIGEKHDFSKRVEYQGPNDEVGQLATTFNEMLARLQEAFQKVEHSLEMQRNFVADVSHELRTPLTTLRGNLGLMRKNPPAPQDVQEDVLNDMEEESDRLIRLVNDLLSLARADTGRSLANELINLSGLIYETHRQFRLLFNEREINCSIPDNLQIMGDHDAVKQILLIVLDNAIKHSPKDIEISATQKEYGVEVRVIDHGQGISQDKLPYVFERFYRGNENSLETGFGLGLSIAKELIEKQGGKIELKSEVGKGSEVFLQFSAVY